LDDLKQKDSDSRKELAAIKKQMREARETLAALKPPPEPKTGDSKSRLTKLRFVDINLK
jgi:hypothetical protein